MKKYISTIALCLIFCSPAFAVQAVTETYTYAGVPTREDAEGKSEGLHGTVGAAILGTEKIRGHNGGFIGVTPIFMMRYEDTLYVSFASAGLWMLQNDDHSLRFGAGLQPHGGWHSGDDPTLSGMEDREASIDAYVNAAWRAGFVTVGASYYHDILNGNRGDAASLRFLKDFRPSEKFRFTPSIGFEWQNSERVDYYYGVRPQEVRPNRPAFTGVPAVNMTAGTAIIYRLENSWSLLTGVFATRLGNGISNSPIVSRRYAGLAYIGVGLGF